jgi:hypothetical protein
MLKWDRSLRYLNYLVKESAMDSDLRTNPVPVTTDNGDHDLFAHIVQPA